MSTPEQLAVAYLTNQYPKTSHTFIRREIAALEGLGVKVVRLTIRPTREQLVDPADRAELDRTRAILGAGATGLGWAVVCTALCNPRRFAKAARLALRIGRSSDRGLLRHAAYLAEACVLRRWLAQSGVEHVHAHFSTNATAVAMLCFVVGGPGYSFTCHGGSELDTMPHGGLAEKVGYARFVVAASSFMRSQVMRLCSYADWAKIHVVRCAVDDAYLAVPPAPVPLRPRLVCVGRLCREKLQLVLIRAAGLLKREGVALELVLVGDGEMRSAVEGTIAQEALRDEVRLTGWADEDRVRQEIDAARALVLPAAMEGLPVVCMEALAAGRPVVSTYVAGIPELVRPDENGWLVPASDVDALAAAMREVLAASPDRLSAMGVQGRGLVERHHDVRTEAARLANLILDHCPQRFRPTG